MRIYVFTGPTLSPEAGRAELEAVYLPPVSQGDVYRVGLQRPQAIGIIDGYFERVPAVWHKEILWAMTQGIHVYGSASMGALRAAELSPFGMEGVGEIFEAYRDGRLEDDDEVAVAHGYAETGYRPLSEAMINIRCTLAAAELAGLLRPVTRAALERIAKVLFYPERSYPRILEQALAEGLPAAELERFRDWLPRGHVNQKQQDAVAMLRVMREQLAAGPEPKGVSFTLEYTAAWDPLTVLAGAADADPAGSVEMVTTSLLIDELRLNDGAYTRAFQTALLRHLALSEAQRQRCTVEADAAKKAAAVWHSEYGLSALEELDSWLEANHLTREQFEELMRDEALVERISSQARWEVVRRLPNHLRVTGEYGSLLARAREKQRVLEARGLENPAPEDVGLRSEALFEWHFQRLGRPVPASIRQYARQVGFSDEDAFLRAVLREYCYQKVMGDVR
jgi:hypothetical protein